MKIFFAIIVLVVIIFGVSFALLNATQVTIDYYLGVQKLPLSLLLFVTFVVGLVIGFLIASRFIIRLKYRVGRLKRKLKLADQELTNLRRMPLEDR